MRLLYALLLVLTVPLCSFAQHKGLSHLLATQLKEVLTEVPNGFKCLKGDEVAGKDEDDTYASTLTLQGTTDNQIGDFDNGGSYIATLGEVNSDKAAQAVIDSWKKKVIAIVGSSYVVSKGNQDSTAAAQKGYILASDKVSISIYYVKQGDEDRIRAFLLIMRS